MRVFYATGWKWGFWVIVFGVGIWIAVDAKEPLLFSERYGHTKVWRFAGLRVKWLK